MKAEYGLAIFLFLTVEEYHPAFSYSVVTNKLFSVINAQSVTMFFF